MQTAIYRKSQAMKLIRSRAANANTAPWLKLTSFAALMNQKVVVLSSESDYVAVEQHFFDECLRPLISRIVLDEDWYLERYPDVGQAIMKNIVKNAKDHYERFGYFEHRLPYLIQVQEVWYCEQYADVKDAIANRAFASGQSHFEMNGFREGRMPHPHFELALT
jgi:hypothetical protein